MSEYLHVEKPCLDQLAELGWTVIDQGQGFIPSDPAVSLRGNFREWLLPEVFRNAVRAINCTADGTAWLNLLSPFGQQRLKDLMSGNAITRLTLEKINAFYIPVGHAEEQRRIADRLNAIQYKMLSDGNGLQKLRQQKHGLMHDLLTGKVRVKVEQASVERVDG